MSLAETHFGWGPFGTAVGGVAADGAIAPGGVMTLSPAGGAELSLELVEWIVGGADAALTAAGTYTTGGAVSEARSSDSI